MKLLSTVLLAAVAVSGIYSAPTREAPFAPAPDPVDQLSSLRSQILRYENPIIHTFLARAALNGTVEDENTIVEKLLKREKGTFAQPDSEVGEWLESRAGSQFVVAPYPPGVEYDLQPVLPNDADLTHGGVGEQIYPTGRRPQDPVNLVDFVQVNLTSSPITPTLDPAAAVSLDISLYHLISSRMLLGYQIGLAKFHFQTQQFCSALAQPAKDRKRKIIDLLTDNKVQVNTLKRIQNKAEAYTTLFANDPANPPHLTDAVLRLFQAYLVPITTEIEAQAVLEQQPSCQSADP